MKDILEHLETIPTGRRYPQSPDRSFVAEVTKDLVREIEPQGFGVRKEYRHRLVLSVLFECCDAELHHLEPIVRRELIYKLYGGMIEQLDSAINRLMSDDTEQALNILTQLRSWASGEIK